MICFDRSQVRSLFLSFVAVVLACLLVGPSMASADSLDCQLCHSFPGLSRLDKDTGELHLYFTSPQHSEGLEGPHARLACTDCHSREEIATVPHEDVTPVDCTQTCHITSAEGVRHEFSHAPVAERLKISVHEVEVLAALPFDEPPLREGQSPCLYCHDQPVLRTPERFASGYRGDDPETRCMTCHDDSLPVDVEYFLRHTAGRLQSARPVRETARACAYCHSDHDINEHAGLHDAVTSYFRSFHGKANLLGGRDTAVCVDCHRTDDGDVHGMLASNDPRSRTHEDHLATTCRSSGCHGDAVPELGDAGVHLRLDPDSFTVEYFVFACFVLLIVAVMSLYYLLFLLEMLRAAFSRHDPQHDKDLALVRAVSASRKGRRLLKRMTVHQRVQHWLLVVFFVMLAATGMPMKFAYLDSMQSLSALLGGLASIRFLHHFAGFALLGVFGYHVIYLGIEMARAVVKVRREDDSKGLLRTIAELAWWSPMMIRPDDIKQFAYLFGYLLGIRKHRPELPKYHFHHKFEYMAVFWGMGVIGASGVMLWAQATSPQLLGGRALNFAHIVHSDEAFLAVVYIVLAHMLAVIFSPPVLPQSLGSLTGDAPDAENVEGHMALVREVAEELGIEAPAEEHENGGGVGAVIGDVIRRLYALALVASIVTLAVVTLSGLFAELEGGHTEVDVDEISVRLDAESLTPSSPDGRDSAGAGAVRKSPYQRGPLSHFHVIPAWFTADPANGCTTGGCHEVLPHGEKKESRAFLNMHSTFLDCLVCHQEEALTSSDITWVSTTDRSLAELPAVLRLRAKLAAPPPESIEAIRAFHKEIRALLGEANDAAGGDWELTNWLFELETSRLGGVSYVATMHELRQGISRHGRGEYGAKLGVPGLTFHPDVEQTEAARLLTDDGGPPDEARREELVKVVHRGTSRPEVECTRCHAESEGLMKFEELGYSAERAADLQHNKVERYSRSVEEGATFYLPSVLRPGGSPDDTPEEPGEGAPGDEVPTDGKATP